MHATGASKNIWLHQQDGSSSPNAPQRPQDWQEGGKSHEDETIPSVLLTHRL